ncbi:MAG: thiazole biosynthesis protein [Candidatus Helarchaeota archaeon]|nr:thiazole biosynthesis protein [Candidatus Helarchaeota archaeon]
MKLDEVTITKAIIENFSKIFIEHTDVDVAIAGAGPAGMVAAKELAENNVKTVVFERKLSVGGGMHGGGAMMPIIVVQKEGKQILEEYKIKTTQYEPNYYCADSIESVAKITSGAIDAGAKIFNLISVEDVMIRGEDKRITGFVLNWSAVELAKLHVDPITIRAKLVIDATGHAAEICHIVLDKIPGATLKTSSGKILGELPMWAEIGEKALIENTIEVYPGLIVAGMAANAVLGSPRMGPIFGGMLISGKQAAKVALDLLKR